MNETQQDQILIEQRDKIAARLSQSDREKWLSLLDQIERLHDELISNPEAQDMEEYKSKMIDLHNRSSAIAGLATYDPSVPKFNRFSQLKFKIGMLLLTIIISVVVISVS